MSVHRAWYAALCLALFAGDAPAQPRPRPVEPGFLFKGGYVNVRAPKTRGWFLLDNSGTGISFAGAGLSKGESLAAQVMMFELAPAQTPEEFIILVKEGVAKNHDAQRFDVIESRTEYSSE